MMLAGGAENADHRCAGGGGDVHETGVITDRCTGVGEKVNGFLDVGAASQVNAMPRFMAVLDNGLRHRPIAFTAQ